MASFSCLTTSDITAITALLSWVHALKTWTNVSVSSSLPFIRKATLICHGIPRFPNQSVWLSRYFLGKYFIAQSWTTSVDFLSRVSSTSTLAASWWMLLNICDFQEVMFCLACFTENLSSSPTLCRNLPLSSTSVASMSSRVDISWLHLSQESWWIWSHLSWNTESLGSLKANTWQWSGTVERLEMWTCKL